ncbi:MAG: redoxin domain-containing protein, partial [Phycisphaerae bacterium]|nr:redoxin domain-containing protein [Phycisphaerae bacterium]
RNGIYEVKENEPYPGHLVRIEAPGYKSANSRVFKDNEVNVTFDFKLEKDTWRKITILSPDGQPAVGAEIAVCTPSQQTMVQNGKFQRMQTPNILTTDAKGKFSLPSQTEPYKLIIVHDTGCANLSEDKIKSTSEIKLDAWGSVEGTIFMGAKPADGQIVNLMETSSSMPDGKTPRCHFYYTTNTDPKGHFVFNRVFSGQWNAARGVRYGNSVSFTNNERVEVKSGETSQVKIGGTGRPVIGKIVLPEDADFQADWTYGHYGISTKQKQPAIFEKVMKMSMEERKKWYETWKDSEEAKALQKSQKKNWRSYSFRVNPDGTFRAEDIPAGTYTLNISLYEPPKGGGCGYGQQIGTVNHDFTIPQMPNGRSDEPLDLGMIELNIPKHLKTGTTAPDFEVKTLDGKTIKLSDLKGKYVLLDFWATWCGPCVAEMPHLKEIHKKFGSDEHFVMISLSLDNSPDDLKSFVEKNDLKWLQGYLGKWADTKVPANYGVNSIPSIFLIDPDGKIIEKQLRGQAIETAVEKVLQQSNR